MARLDLRLFPQVWIVGCRCRHSPGERPDVLCLAAQELRSGEIMSFHQDDLARLSGAPYRVGPGSLFICYDTVTVLACHFALGWRLPCRVVDLQIEFRCRLNGMGWREEQKRDYKLAHAAEYFGMNPLEAAEKASVQGLAARGGPFTPDERRRLMGDCERRVAVMVGLLERMGLSLSLRALQRGRFSLTAAQMLHDGIPLDAHNLGRLQRYRGKVMQAVVGGVDPALGVFEGIDFKPERMEALVSRYGLPWPRLESGCLRMDKRTWVRMVGHFPFLRPLHNAWRTLELLPDNGISVGRDGRSRYSFFPYATETGRNSWKAGEFIFAQPTYLRGLVQPPPGKALAYLDYGQQEFAVAAVLSGDGRMMEAYRADDPYLTFGRQAGLIPLHATRETHAAERKKLKTCVLGLQFLISEYGLADQLEIQTDYARVLIEAHRRVYRRFWQWAEAVIDGAVLDGFQETLMGWRTSVYDGEVLRQGRLVRRFNKRAAVNFPVQGGAADVTRLACNLVCESGIPLLANVHDALLIEGDDNGIDRLADEAEALMVRAGRELLQGFTLKVDRRIVRHPGRLLHEGEDHQRWSWLVGQLDRFEAAEMLQFSNTGCCTSAT